MCQLVPTNARGILRSFQRDSRFRMQDNQIKSDGRLGTVKRCTSGLQRLKAGGRRFRCLLCQATWALCGYLQYICSEAGVVKCRVIAFLVSDPSLRLATETARKRDVEGSVRIPCGVRLGRVPCTIRGTRVPSKSNPGSLHPVCSNTTIYSCRASVLATISTLNAFSQDPCSISGCPPSSLCAITAFVALCSSEPHSEISRRQPVSCSVISFSGTVPISFSRSVPFCGSISFANAMSKHF